MFAQYKDGVIVGLFGCPQPDALDDKGNVICAGVETVEVTDQHADVIAFKESLQKMPEAKPTIDDVIALLSPEQQSALVDMKAVAKV